MAIIECSPAAYTVAEFCTAHRVSRSMLYKMWRAGTGPRIKHVGTKILITAESAAAWRATGEADKPQAQVA